MNLAWHFVRLGGTPGLQAPVLRDGSPMPAPGEWLTVDGPLSICSRGLHASWRAIDALEYCSWDNAAACLVEVDGIAEEQTDKLVCARRRVIDWVPCDDLLRLFAREAALSVAKYWTMPAIVREYLETGDEAKRAAAWAAAWAAARDAARDAAWAAARDAAWAAARDAAWDAAWAAARDAARDAAGDDLNSLLESILLADMEVSR